MNFFHQRILEEKPPRFNDFTLNSFSSNRKPVTIATDASLTGFGAVFGNRFRLESWDQKKYPPSEPIKKYWVISPCVHSLCAET